MSDCIHEIKMTFVQQSSQIEMAVEGGASIENVVVADKLRTPRQIALTGDTYGNTLFDGSEDVRIFTALEVLTNEDIEAMLT